MLVIYASTVWYVIKCNIIPAVSSCAVFCSLDPQAFSDLDVLTELDLTHNLLTSLPAQLISGLNNLQVKCAFQKESANLEFSYN